MNVQYTFVTFVFHVFLQIPTGGREDGVLVGEGDVEAIVNSREAREEDTASVASQITASAQV